MRSRAAFLDRDGVINVRPPDGGYVTRWEDFVYCPGVTEALKTLRETGYLLLVVTNQRGVGRGLMSQESLEEIHRNMRRELAAEGAPLDAVYYCPHDLDAGCRCRKPLPGMIERGVREFNVDAAASCIIGDSPSDMEAGRSAGLARIFITSPREVAPPGCRTAPSLLAAARMLAGEPR